MKTPFDEFPPCDICEKDSAECQCPICPRCGEQGNPTCIGVHAPAELWGINVHTQVLTVAQYMMNRFVFTSVLKKNIRSLSIQGLVIESVGLTTSERYTLKFENDQTYEVPPTFRVEMRSF